MEVLKQENVISTNRACFPRLCVAAGFATAFAGGACIGFQVGSIMFLQGNNVKVFVKIKVLKSQGVKCRCTYGVTLPRGYLQVVRWWQRWCLRICCNTSWSNFQPSTTTPTCVVYRLHCCSFSVPTKEIMQVYLHLGTHATPAVNASKIRNSYCDLRVFGAFLRHTAVNCSVGYLPLRACFCNHLFARTTGNQTQEVVIKYFP